MRHSFVVFVLLAFIVAPASAAQLLMIEKAGCEWCERWDEEIGIIYAKTSEGKRVPLERHEIGSLSATNYVLTRNVRYTPTFIVVEESKEVGRIEGYPGESFFWEMLDQILSTMADQ